MILKGVRGGLFHAGFLAALLLVPAGLVSGGTWRWPRALVFLAAYCVILEAAVIVIAVAAPAQSRGSTSGAGVTEAAGGRPDGDSNSDAIYDRMDHIHSAPNATP